jgi:hypothetical protein
VGVVTTATLALACGNGASRDPLDGTMWQSSTIATTSASNGVTSSTYAIMFGAGSVASDGSGATGPFSATFTQVYGATAAKYPACTEVTTFSGGTWVDDTTSSTQESVSVSGALGKTTRTGCSMSQDDVMGLSGAYDDAVNQTYGTPFSVSGATLTFAQSTAVTPYIDDGTTWTFTKM